MFIEIAIHYFCQDDTLGDILNLYSRLNHEVRLSDSYQSGLYEDYPDKTGEDDIQILEFSSLKALETFLSYALAQAAMVLSHSTGDDASMDYTPSFVYQYQQFLQKCLEIDLSESDVPDYLKDDHYTISYSFPRTLKMSIEFFNNVILNHQSSNHDEDEEDSSWFEGSFEPIELESDEDDDEEDDE